MLFLQLLQLTLYNYYDEENDTTAEEGRNYKTLTVGHTYIG